MNLKDLGREAGRALMSVIAGEGMRGVRRLPCTLVVRDSCGAGTAAGVRAKAAQAAR